MVEKKLTLCTAALLSAAFLQATAAEDAPPKPSDATRTRVNKAEESAKTNPKDAESKKEGDAGTDKTDTDKVVMSADEPEMMVPEEDREALFGSAEAFVDAYNKGDAKAIASQFSPNAEYTDEQGYRFRGRATIERAFAECFDVHKGAQIELTIHSLRLVAPGAAIEDGTTTMSCKERSAGSVETNYTAMHMKIDGKWQTVSVRETAPKGRREHKAQLQQLSWLMGDWVDEGEDTLVASSCKAIQGGNFLLREFRLHVGGQEIISGEQRIGWDPPTSKLKSWVFDSDGGYSEGFWQHDDDRWILKSVGVSTDGQPASCTTIYTVINENTMTWQTVDHEVAGAKIPDSEVITVVRRAPSPTSEGDKLTSQER